MTKREFLRGYIIAGRRLAVKENQLNRLCGEAYEGIKEDVRREAEELREKRLEVLRVIETAPTELQRTMLEARFINGMTPKNISVMVGYGKSHQYRMYADAMQKMKFPEGVV
ncbi:MAG: hypothetical protein IKA47_08260 [Oscillospiraceae bacterium]|nr:hypothetical protein [Oscillospiraceae bacterium]